MFGKQINGWLHSSSILQSCCCIIAGFWNKATWHGI